MTPTTYGYRTIGTSDPAKGANGWFASINFNTSRLDSHNHDGANSALLSSASFPIFTNAIAASWSASGSGYKQTITVPTGVTEINNYNVKFVFTAPGAMVGQLAYLGYKRITATTFDVYCNDNTAAFTAVYR